jgi:DNA repair exonuclease SbcCD ATPase subunit
MAKIKITENELKQIIRESVEGVLNEVNYAMDWNKLSSAEKQNIAKSYDNLGGNAVFRNMVTSYTYPDGTTGTSQSKQMADGTLAQGTPSYDMKRAQKIYNRKRDRKDRKGNLNYSVDQYNALAGQIADKDAEIKEKDTQIANLNNALSQIGNALKEGVTRINEAGEEIRRAASRATSTIQDAGKNYDPNAVPNLQNILTAIGKLKQQVSGLTTQLAQAKRNAAAKPVAPTNTPVQQQGQQNRPAAAPMTPGQAPAIAASTNTAAGLARTNVPGNSRA